MSHCRLNFGRCVTFVYFSHNAVEFWFKFLCSHRPFRTVKVNSAIAVHDVGPSALGAALITPSPPRARGGARAREAVERRPRVPSARHGRAAGREGNRHGG